MKIQDNATNPTYNHLIIQENVTLKDKNWFNTGGNAKFFTEPFDSESFRSALEFAHENKKEIFILGEGANILISDDGFDGLVIRPQIKNIVCENFEDESVLVKAGAGTPFKDLINFCLNNNIIGLEEFSGIPGTVGGSVYINIHYFEFLLSQFLVSANVIEKKTGKILNIDNNWFKFGYDQSTLQNLDYFLIDATFKLKKTNLQNAWYSKGRSDEIIKHRVKKYPNKGTCGSFFRNFHENEVTFTSNGKKIIFTAYYLDKIGVKGNLKFGDAIVSYQHANMIVNQGNATSTDIINLAREMQKLVKDNFGIIPQPECQLIGFKEYPLI